MQQHNQWTLSFPCHFPRTKVQHPTTVTNINIRNKMNIKPPSLLLAIYIGVTSQGRRRTHDNLRKNILLRNYKNNINLNYNFSHFVHVRARRTIPSPPPKKDAIVPASTLCKWSFFCISDVLGRCVRACVWVYVFVGVWVSPKCCWGIWEVLRNSSQATRGRVAS